MKKHTSKIPYKLTERKISDKGYPVHAKHYTASHEASDTLERHAYPEGFKSFQNKLRKLPKGELMATHTKDGKITVSSKWATTKSEQKELAYHEYNEWLREKQLDEKNKNNRKAISDTMKRGVEGK